MILFFLLFFKKALLKMMILNMNRMMMNFPTSESVPVRPLYSHKMCHLLFRPLYSHLLFSPQIAVLQLLHNLLQLNLILDILRITRILLQQFLLIFWTYQCNVMWPLYSLRPLYSLQSPNSTLKTL